MSAVEALKAARAAGIQIAVDGEDLALAASAPPPASVLELLAHNKADVIALLRPTPDGWSAEDWIAFYDERAGIVEYDGGLPRGQAEERAFACCAVEWLNRNPECSPPGRCLGCGGVQTANDTLLPFGSDLTGHAWLHSRCWEAWHASRNAAAVAALATFGIYMRTSP